MIQYQFTRIEPLIDPATNNVIKWVVGLTATDTDDPSLSAYIDAEVPVPEDNFKPQADWTDDEIRAFAIQYALKEEYTTDPDTGTKEYTKQNWFNQLKAQVEAKKGQPIRGSTIVI
jgi:hypothetical protein